MHNENWKFLNSKWNTKTKLSVKSWKQKKLYQSRNSKECLVKYKRANKSVSYGEPIDVSLSDFLLSRNLLVSKQINKTKKPYTSSASSVSKIRICEFLEKNSQAEFCCSVTLNVKESNKTKRKTNLQSLNFTNIKQNCLLHEFTNSKEINSKSETKSQ